MNNELIIFGLTCVVLAVLAVGAVFTPLWRGRTREAAEDTDINIYRDQLLEVDRDLARGVLDEAEAERTRTEVSRRLLTADANARATSTGAPQRVSRAVALILAAALIAGAGGLYWELGAAGYGDVPRAERIAIGEERRANRPSQLEAEADSPEFDSISLAEPETAEILQALRAAAFERADEVQAWAYLAQVEASVGNMQRAARAQERTIALLGDTVTEADYVRLLDFLVIGTQGYVSPEAETITVRILQNNPESTPALYYAGLLYAQNDRPDRAFNFWRNVVENGEQDTMYWDFAASQISDIAAQLGMDYALPEQRGPSNADLEAAEDMTTEERQQMIQGMVSQLADRLASEGGPPQDWARLVSSLAILGENETALTVLAEAETIFGADIQAVQIVRRAAQEAGLIE
ncbi:MAG TPA: c-type cytochrome biogenesis protein CcmI [Octadecabacter sp.]|nr:c-type cytochrome biogenesis protein CcmI [Octadecabacter sp.]